MSIQIAYSTLSERGDRLRFDNTDNLFSTEGLSSKLSFAQRVG